MSDHDGGGLWWVKTLERCRPRHSEVAKWNHPGESQSRAAAKMQIDKRERDRGTGASVSHTALPVKLHEMLNCSRSQPGKDVPVSRTRHQARRDSYPYPALMAQWPLSARASLLELRDLPGRRLMQAATNRQVSPGYPRGVRGR